MFLAKGHHPAHHRHLGRMAVLAAALFLPTGAAVGNAFVPGTRDVPLMEGMTPLAGEALVFDKPAGRIVQAEASGTASPDTVRRFYAETLPQLGWRAAGVQAWLRESERLDLGIEQRGGRTFVRFTLSPSEDAGANEN